jgi:hypothetical protein
MFRKVEINIPLLDAIKHIHRYAKFVKELCTIKMNEKLIGNETINIRENVFAIIQKKLPLKEKDKGSFFIPCQIGNISF